MSSYFFVRTMHGLIDHFTSLLWTWAIKCPRYVESFPTWRYALNMLHWSKSLIARTSFWAAFFDGDDTMDILLDMTKVFPILCLFLFITDWCCTRQYFFFCSCRVIVLAHVFGKMVAGTAIMDAISSWFSAMDNDLLNASGHYPADKKEERITFSLSQIIWDTLKSDVSLFSSLNGSKSERSSAWRHIKWCCLPHIKLCKARGDFLYRKTQQY